VRQMKLTKNYVERDKSDLSEKYSEEGMNKSAKEPFVIKKTASVWLMLLRKKTTSSTTRQHSTSQRSSWLPSKTQRT